MQLRWILLGALVSVGALAGADEERQRLRPLPPASANAKTGPEVGKRIPAFQLTDQDGKTRTFESLRGPKGLMLIFSRSADWCPYCKTQLADINQQLEGFRKQGLGVAAVTYDSNEVLKDFSTRLKIGFPLLSDAGSKTIRAFGILNDNVDPKTPQYGIPFPGTYVVNEKGVVTSKFFEADYRERYSGASILSHVFGADGVEKTEIDSPYMVVTTSASDSTVAPGHRVTLMVEIAPKPKMHVYAPGVSKSYMPVDWQIVDSEIISVTAAAFPPSTMVNLPAIQETVPVYDKRARITRDIVIGQEAEVAPVVGAKRELSVYGTLRYQACDDRQCYLPKTVPLKWTFPVDKLDTARPPVEIQRKLN